MDSIVWIGDGKHRALLMSFLLKLSIGLFLAAGLVFLFVRLGCEARSDENRAAQVLSQFPEELRNEGGDRDLKSSDPRNWGGRFPEGSEWIVLGHLDDTFHEKDGELQRLLDFLEKHKLTMRYGQTHVGIAEVEIQWKEWTKARRLIFENGESFPSFMKFEKAFEEARDQ